MNEVSVIINGVRYDAVDDSHTYGSHNCDLYDKDNGLITCGNAILSGSEVKTKHTITDYL